MSTSLDDPERLTAIAAHIRDSASFLALRSSLRNQFLRLLESAPATQQSEQQPPVSMLSSSLLSAIRSLNASAEGGGHEGLPTAAADFVTKALLHKVDGKGISALVSSGDHRTQVANRLTRDATLWTTRALDSQMRVKWALKRRSVSAPERKSLPSSEEGPVNGGGQSNASDALMFLISSAQREWRALISVRVESLKILTQFPLVRSYGASHAASADDSSASPRSASSNGSAAPVISADDLFSTLVERVNHAAPAAWKRRSHQIGPCDDGTSSLFVENMGFFTSFRATVWQLARDSDLVPTITQLREALAELDPAAAQGRQEMSHASLTTIPCSESVFLQLLEHGDRPDILCSLAMRGVPPSQRRLVYAKLLNLPLAMSASALQNPKGVCETKRVRFATANAAKSLSDSVQQGRSSSTGGMSADPTMQSRQLVRQMVATDVSARIGDSDKYFVFVDECTSVATAMVEDSTIADLHLKRVMDQRGEDYHMYLSAAVGAGGLRLPASGVMPFTTTSSVLGPLVYLTGDLCEFYELAAAMQGQVWAPLQSCTPDLLGMLLTFEEITMHYAPSAVYHCFSKLGFAPASLAIRWMINGFADMFEPTETLALWDAALAIHSRSFFFFTKAKPYWVLAAAAAAVFVFRAALVQQCFSASQVAKIFEDGVKLQPIPLIQQMLFLL